ncbi:MAG TPA: HipA family kinase [Terriglobales bacterium]|nr:HipA family kinase [Terriglobales bacterium]
MSIKAITRVRRLRGGSQAQLMAADDGRKYVIKFQGNPQTTRVLANEYLAGRLARMIGLSLPEPAIIQVDAETIRRCDISFQFGGTEIAPTAGLQFGSRLIVDEEVHDWLPSLWLGKINNVREFAGILAFDKWTGNADGRQVVFHKRRSQRRYTAAFIDFGYCFNAAEWSFPDSPLRGVYARQEVYAHIDSWNDFEPWLSRIEGCSLGALEGIAEEIPTKWYGARQDVDRLIHSLFDRQAVVRQLIEDFRKSHRSPFPKWTLDETGRHSCEHMRNSGHALETQVV